MVRKLAYTIVNPPRRGIFTGVIPHSIFLGYVHPDTVPGRFPLQVLELGMWQDNLILEAGACDMPNNAKSRNVVVDMFLASNCEWLGWIDSDCIVHPNAFQKLRALARENDALVAAGFAVGYDRHTKELFNGAWNFYDGHWHNLQEVHDEAYWCDGVGCHFALWHRSVYEDILERPYHIDYIEHPLTGESMGHDLAICLRLKDAGVRVLYCPEVLTWHSKTWDIGKEELDRYLESLTVD